jgi:putative transposase
MGFMKGKTAIHIARMWAGRRKRFVGQQFWARGYWGRRWAGTKARCADIFGSKRTKTSVWTNLR